MKIIGGRHLATPRLILEAKVLIFHQFWRQSCRRHPRRHPKPSPPNLHRPLRPARTPTAERLFEKSSFSAFITTLIFGPLGFVLESQNGSKINAKSINVGFPSCSCLSYFSYTDFGSLSVAKLDPPRLKNHAPASARARFFNICLSKLASIFDATFIPTLLHLGFRNRWLHEDFAAPRGSQSFILLSIDFQST